MGNLVFSRRAFLTGVTAAGVSLTLPQAASAATFIDVPPSTAFSHEINWLARIGITTGWDTPHGKEYRPLLSIKRDAMAAFLYRHAGYPAFTPPTVSPFSDLSPSQQFYKEMCWLRSQGISTGWVTARGAEYRPLEPINRDAMAAFLYRYAGSPNFSAPVRSPFVDLVPSQQFYKEMCWLYAQGISTGWVTARGAEYRPLEPINRDAMAAFLYRFSHKVKPVGKVSPVTPSLSYEQQVVQALLPLVNAERAKVGSPALKHNLSIQKVAQGWSGVMAREDSLYHNPSYSDQIPAGWNLAAENVAYNWKKNSAQDMAKALMTQWMNSPGHRRNILTPGFTDFGAGVSITAANKVFGCQVFARY
ncbi:CAP domain-containing protein [Rothia sp. ZJ1223]|uniref:CAP domain-containing protein n=1 Tax=Rothia sp. ZJ1223 TaxID=2811098 RepID=UPI00195C0EBC|nr:CAP domain-containing protein [Rothia sp. ZJ1223]